MRSKNKPIGKGTNPVGMASSSMEQRKGLNSNHQAERSRQALMRVATLAVIPPSRNQPGNTFAALTPREREVLRFLAEGYSSKQIADELRISVNTVNNHRAAMFLRLKVHSAAGALKWYWAGGTE